MKKLSILLLLITVTVCSFSQVTDTTAKPMLKGDYLKKSKNQKTTAYVLLGVGVALDIGGIIATVSNANKTIDNITGSYSSNVNHGTELALYITGTAALLGSLPFFIASKTNKKKAMSLVINTRQFLQLNKNNFSAVNYPALTMKYNF